MKELNNYYKTICDKGVNVDYFIFKDGEIITPDKKVPFPCTTCKNNPVYSKSASGCCYSILSPYVYEVVT